MFTDCSELISLDLRTFNTGNVKRMQRMFAGCSGLATIKVDVNNWNTSNVTQSDSMFEGCTSLVGGKGTTYDVDHIDVAYAHIDGGTSNPGYLSDVNAPQDNVAISAKSYTREYGEENPKFEYDVTEGTITSGTPEITSEATTASSVGTYDIVVSKGSVSNNEVALTNGTLTITKALLVISVGEYTKQEGEENPEFELTYEGFKNGESDGVLTRRPVVTCIATKDSEPGEYVITIDGAEAENYDIRYAPGKLTVTAKETGIRNVNGNGNDDAYYTLDGKKLDTAPKKGGIYVGKGRLSIKR